MSERLDRLWNQLVEVKRTKGIDHPDFERAFEAFCSEQERQGSRRRSESLGSPSNGFGPQHTQRNGFGARNHEPDPDEI
jgi:hypothetical protein